ncbi:hypothetical protein [Pyxidicoccus sp. MSG2]|uniref:hypothetical protein n=1 Tax=Pyxidicoccus sp. MSG2 TaxID=2996790 RepID=UPI00226F1C6E|nr:hypothetical protein [Pyxidicoccus sp. MSG2]MCY1018399.1 hypothetical protein [Pyxidicoccus sp. MSG2]
MASTRTRSASQAAASSPEEASLAPWAPAQSLAELKDAMSSPGVIPAEVDALLAAMARPPADDETPRARADLLLSLMDLPEDARDRTGSNGKTVRAAAVEALLELGYPYALEVHPDVLDDVRQQAGGSKRDSKAGGSTTGVVLTVLAMVVQLIMVVLFFSSSVYGSNWETFQLIGLGLLVGPPLLALFGHLADSKGLRSLGARGMTLQGLAWLAFSGINAMGASSSQVLALMVMIPWYLPLAAAYHMRAKSEPGGEPPALATPPTEPS